MGKAPLEHAMHDEVGITPNGRSEMRVLVKTKREVSQRIRGIARLLQGTQHQIRDDALFRLARKFLQQFLVMMRRDAHIGGGQSDIGAEQPLRGFGTGRFRDRNSFSTTVELRRKLLTFDASATTLDIETAPFIDIGRVFASSRDNPFRHVHPVYGVGFRGIARPFVVGYVDVGYGSEGAAVFTGLNYPF